MVAKFLDLNKLWSCKYGRKKKEKIDMYDVPLHSALRNKTVACTFLWSSDNAMAISVKKERWDPEILIPW